MRTILKSAGAIIMILSLFGLSGCGILDQRQAKQIEKKLSEMYEGKTFEVLALGNRWGTLTNDTVTAHVKDVERDIVFVIKMNTKGEIVANTYPARAMNKQVEEILNNNLKKEGITAESSTVGVGFKGDIRNLNPNMPINEYISNFSIEYFSGDLIVKESENNTGEGFINAFRKTFENIQNTELLIHVWIISQDYYDKVAEEFSTIPNVSGDWFESKNPVAYFRLNIDKDGEVNMSENELNRLLQGGE